MDRDSLKSNTCNTCAAYDDQHQGQGEGVCKRHAPGFVQMPVMHPITRQRGMVPMAAWPIVHKEMSCLDHVPAKTFKLDS